MSLRQLGLIVVGVFFMLGSLPLFIAGDVVTGAGSLLFALVLIVVPVAELMPDGSGPRLEDGALVVRVNRARRVLLTVGAVLFAASSGLLLAGAGGTFARLAGALGVLTFGTFAVIGLWQLRGPFRLVMTPEVLRWDQGAAGAPVDWDDITSVGIHAIMGARSMTIHVDPPRGGLLVRLSRRLGGGDVNVPLNQLSVDYELLLSIVTVCAREPDARTTIVTEATLRRLQA